MLGRTLYLDGAAVVGTSFTLSEIHQTCGVQPHLAQQRTKTTTAGEQHITILCAACPGANQQGRQRTDCNEGERGFHYSRESASNDDVFRVPGAAQELNQRKREFRER